MRGPAACFRLLWRYVCLLHLCRITAPNHGSCETLFRFWKHPETCPKDRILAASGKLTQRIFNSHAENSPTNWFSFRDRASRESIGARADLKLEPCPGALDRAVYRASPDDFECNGEF